MTIQIGDKVVSTKDIFINWGGVPLRSVISEGTIGECGDIDRGKYWDLCNIEWDIIWETFPICQAGIVKGIKSWVRSDKIRSLSEVGVYNHNFQVGDRVVTVRCIPSGFKDFPDIKEGTLGVVNRESGNKSKGIVDIIWDGGCNGEVQARDLGLVLNPELVLK